MDAYVAKAGSIDLFILRAGEIAQSRGTSLRVREVAGRLIASHKGTSQQLSLAARRLNLLPSATLEPIEQERLDRVIGQSDFDAAFRQEMRAAIKDGLELHRRYARSGTSPTLRPVAEMATAVYERDMRLLGYL